MCISVATGRCPRCPVSRGHDNNAKVATQYFSVIRNLERALGQRGNGARGRGNSYECTSCI